MKVSIVSVFPELYEPFLRTSLINRASVQGLVTCEVTGLMSYVAPKERIDAPPFGPGAGMVLRPEVIERAITKQEAAHGPAFKVFFSPHGKRLTQPLLETMAQAAQERGHLMLIPARYEGMDVRVEDEYADMIVSVGDFVLMGGDVPAMMVLEGVLRLVPGVVGKQESVEYESFSGPFVDYPSYTEPLTWHDKTVPEILRSGNHARIAQWRLEQAVKRTMPDHFEWVRSYALSPDQKKLVSQEIPPHYVVLMHSQILIGDDAQEGTSSVTSIDLHDIARSSMTYGVKQVGIVTPLEDQQVIVKTILDFWQKGSGIEYNKSRSQAVKNVRIYPELEAMVAAIKESEGVDPLVVATSARSVEHAHKILFGAQSMVWSQKRPILFVFGTGKGLTPACIARCDYVLPPVEGLTDYNHLSVRSAVAIVLDRWLGLTATRS